MEVEVMVAAVQVEATVWTGEVDRPSLMSRPCSCGTCEATAPVGGVGYLSASDAQGEGFSVWVFDEAVYQRMLNVYGGEL